MRDSGDWSRACGKLEVGVSLRIGVGRRSGAATRVLCVEGAECPSGGGRGRYLTTEAGAELSRGGIRQKGRERRLVHNILSKFRAGFAGFDREAEQNIGGICEIPSIVRGESKSVPRGVRVRIGRKRNEEEDAREEFYSLVTVAEIRPEGLKGLGTKVIDETD
ncbi:hypothetical protein IEQ34_010060 [Dendrobium chrysotoxum]|uniref:Uncharacterized protein n=1 Tax=Dendrobium chrysotoxum TaxID=161865 RepID=A0AAV7H4Q0_DENCH|nr:hypothetical protein IEQ34_010060 [Dendrobium chrysotoxum]